jgi:formate-dependent nitrite reductase membrane component NrfD
MPDTFFTSSPHWGWYIVAYFFVGGIAGGCFFIASLLHLFGRPEDRPVVRMGYYVAFVGAVVSGVLLTLDLTKPLRFWHMLFASNTGVPLLKPWSPMSVGAWGLLLFGAHATLAAAGALAEEGRIQWRALAGFASGAPGMIVAALGSVFGFFLAGYTGVLLSVTNRPVWADSNLVGALFLCSAASTGAAALVLLARRRRDVHPGTTIWLSRFDRIALLAEFAVIVLFVATLGAAVHVFVGRWGVVLAVGVVGFGIVAPLLLEARGAHDAPAVARAAALALAGGLLLRIVVIFASNQVHAAGSGVALP